MRCTALSLFAALLICCPLSAQEQQPVFAKPGPEHAELKKLEGT